MRIVDRSQSALAPKQVSRMKAPTGADEPSFTRFSAAELKPTNRPPALTEGEVLGPFASAPAELMETRLVCGVQPPGAPMHVSRKKMSAAAFVSAPTRLLASDENATKRASALMAGSPLAPLGSVPSNPMEIKIVRGG